SGTSHHILNELAFVIRDRECRHASSGERTIVGPHVDRQIEDHDDTDGTGRCESIRYAPGRVVAALGWQPPEHGDLAADVLAGNIYLPTVPDVDQVGAQIPSLGRRRARLWRACPEPVILGSHPG